MPDQTHAGVPTLADDKSFYPLCKETVLQS